MNKAKLVFKIFLISVFFTFVSYLFYKIDRSKISSFWSLVQMGYPETKKVILSNDILNKVPMAPVFLFWAAIGTIAYLFYHSLDLIYNNVRNWTVIQYFYTQAKSEQELDLKHYSLRILTHIGVIVPYVLFIVTLFLVALPLTSMIFSKFNYFNQLFDVENAKLLIKTVFVLFFWIGFFSFYIWLFSIVHKFMAEEEIIEEHEIPLIEKKTP